MSIVIEKNVPMTKGAKGRWAQASAAIKEMEVGDSFLFPAKAAPAPMYGFAKTAGRKVSMSKVGDGQYRVWRTA